MLGLRFAALEGLAEALVGRLAPMTAEEQLAHVMDEYGVPPGDTDERLLLVLVFWQENQEEPSVEEQAA